MIYTPESPDQSDDSLDALLTAALDSATDDPVRLAIMTKLFFLSADLDRDADLDAMRRDGPPPVFKL